MTESEFKREINNGEISGLYYLYGEEKYLRDYYAQRLKDKVLDEAFADFNLHYYDEHTFSKEEISDAVMSYPMMAEKKVIMFRDTGILSKGESEKEFFADLFADIPEHCVVILCESEVDKIYAPYKAVAKYGKCVEFPYRSVNELKTWIAKAAIRYEKSISERDALYLAEHCGPSMNMLRSEFEKVVSFVGNKKEITRADITGTVSFSDTYKIFALTDAIISGRGDQTFKILSEFHAQKESAVRLVASLSRFYSEILKARLLLDDGWSLAQTAESLSASGYAAKKQTELARKVTESYLKHAVSKLCDADRRIKSGEMEEWNALSLVAGEILTGGHK